MESPRICCQRSIGDGTHVVLFPVNGLELTENLVFGSEDIIQNNGLQFVLIGATLCDEGAHSFDGQLPMPIFLQGFILFNSKISPHLFIPHFLPLLLILHTPNALQQSTFIQIISKLTAINLAELCPLLFLFWLEGQRLLRVVMNAFCYLFELVLGVAKAQLVVEGRRALLDVEGE